MLAVGAAWWAAGGWDAWVALDPMDRPYRPEERAALLKGPYLAWLGDSVCLCQATWSEEDLRTPPLGALAQQRLCGPGGLLGSAWAFVEECRLGSSARGFEPMARAFCAAGAPPRIAVIEVNLRSLNSKGLNGFAGPPRAPRRGALKAEGAALRGLAAWGRNALQGAFSPSALRDEVDPRHGRPPSPEEAAAGFRKVYGGGFVLDGPMLEALLQTGRIFRQSGCRVFYFLAPMERLQFVRTLGERTLAQRDLAAARVVTALTAEGFEALDLQAGPSSGFFEPPTEHLDAGARRRLAEQVVAWLGERLHARPLNP